MTKSYINRIKANIDIYASKKTSNILDGTYTSVFTGRSMNFEDLRDYVPGDGMRDIEWKASTRSGKLLVKRYVAEKKYNMLFVVDTSVRMQGETGTGEIKKELAIYAAGTLAYLAYKNGDMVGAAFANAGKPVYEPFRTGVNNIERILSFCDKATDSSNRKNSMDISTVLNSVVYKLKQRMIIFIVTDMKGASEISIDVLRRLKCVHDVLLIITDDAVVAGVKGKNYDLEQGFYLPPFFTENKKLKKLEESRRSSLVSEVDSKCKKCGIAYVKVDSMEKLTKDIIGLLKAHRFDAQTRATR